MSNSGYLINELFWARVDFLECHPESVKINEVKSVKGNSVYYFINRIIDLDLKISTPHPSKKVSKEVQGLQGVFI